MDVKRSEPHVASATPARESKTRRFFSFIQELKEELRKVSWTTKEELTFATKAVIGSIFVLGLSIYVVDLFIKGILDFISLAVRYMFG